MNAKKVVKSIGKFLLGFTEFLIIYVVAGIFMSFIVVNKNTEKLGEIPIFIYSNGVHTDLVLPVSTGKMDWRKYVKFENTLAKDTTAQFVAFGWGDKGFYLNTPEWSELKASTAFKAAFALSESAIHTTFYNEIIEGEKCVKINLTPERYTLLVDYIKNSFETTENEELIFIPTTAVYGTDDAFYEAKGTYNLFYTCNTWANNGLKSCDQKASLWALLDDGIFYHYR